MNKIKIIIADDNIGVCDTLKMYLNQFEDIEILEQWLSEKKGKRVYVSVPKIGEQKHLVDMCKQNALENLKPEIVI